MILKITKFSYQFFYTTLIYIENTFMQVCQLLQNRHLCKSYIGLKTKSKNMQAFATKAFNFITTK